MTGRLTLVFVLLAVVGAAIPAQALLTERETPRVGSRSAPGRAVVDLPDGRTIALALARVARSGRLDRRLVTASVRGRLPVATVATSRRARVTYLLDVAGTARRILSLGIRGGRTAAVRRAVASRIDAPVVAQRLRNDCEAAALEVLLASVGHRVGQLRIQRAFRRSGTADPVGGVWGDPERGYVGRPAGGGVAGGFGVYPRPVAATARRLGVRLTDLTDARPAAIYRALLRGRAVMTWVGLSNGPYGEWRTPSGRRVRVNFGEHTVVLNGIHADGSIRVINVLHGTTERWTRARFEVLWQRLGHRALGA